MTGEYLGFPGRGWGVIDRNPCMVKFVDQIRFGFTTSMHACPGKLLDCQSFLGVESRLFLVLWVD